MSTEDSASTKLADSRKRSTLPIRAFVRGPSPGALFALAGMCMTSPAHAYRTAADDPAFRGSTRVAVESPPLHFQMVTDSNRTLNSADLELALNRAMETWAAPSCARRPFTYDGATQEVAMPGDGVNTIQWVSDWAARSFPAEAASQTDVQYEKLASGGWRIVEADIYLNAHFAWSAFAEVSAGAEAPDAPKDVQAVLTHELGHAAGLMHPCERQATALVPACAPDDEGICMNPTYSVGQRSLSPDDVAGICFLYPMETCETTGCGAGEGCLNGECAPLCMGQPCGPDSVCTQRGCVAANSCVASSCLGRACATDNDCAISEYCAAKICKKGHSPTGDPCSSAHDCESGTCSAGVCVVSCSGPADCPAPSQCDVEQGICRDILKVLGEHCSNASECSGAACLKEDEAVPICTRACSEALPACPGGFACRVADGQQVCAPERSKAHGGCAVTSGPNEGNFSKMNWIVALGAMSLLGRRVRAHRLGVAK